MSAFAALKGNSNGGSIFSTLNNSEEEQEDDEGLIQYQANSSDEEINDDEDKEDSPDYGLLLPIQQKKPARLQLQLYKLLELQYQILYQLKKIFNLMKIR